MLILSYVGVAIVSSLRSSAIPLTMAHVSNVCRGMSGDSVKGEREGKKKDERGRDAKRCNMMVAVKGRIAGN